MAKHFPEGYESYFDLDEDFDTGVMERFERGMSAQPYEGEDIPYEEPSLGSLPYDEPSLPDVPYDETYPNVLEYVADAAVMEVVRPRQLPWWLDWLVTIAITVGAVLLVRAFIVDTYVVPTGSMLDTIQLGDRLIGEKVTYRFRDPRPGEVVTFTDPKDPDVILIKRVIAVGGQTVDLIDGLVYVDGAPLDEPYTQGKPSDPIDAYASILDGPVTYPFEIPQGYVWVMGDNRTNSLDSRYFGAIDADTVSARAVLIFWPPSDAGTF